MTRKEATQALRAVQRSRKLKGKLRICRNCEKALVCQGENLTLHVEPPSACQGELALPSEAPADLLIKLGQRAAQALKQ